MFRKQSLLRGIVLSLLFFALVRLYAQDSLDIYLDYSEFPENESLSFVEVYYSFSRTSIKHVNDGNDYIAQYSTKLDIYDGDSLLNSIDHTIMDKLDSIDLLSPAMWISDVYPIILKKGKFKIDFSLTDLNTKSLRQKSIDIEIPPHKKSPFYLSDIQLGFNIKHVSEKSRFVKNGYQVTPNPAKIYNVKWPVLYYYCEVYTQTDNEVIDSCQIISEITDLEGQQIKFIDKKERSINNNGIVDVNKVLVGSLKSGSYFLTVSLADDHNHIYDIKKKLFYVYRQADYIKPKPLTSASQDELLQLYQTMTETEIDKEFEQAEFIATETEKDIFEDLDPASKKTFLVEFWKRREPAGKSNIQNFRTDYMQRIEYANNRFSGGGKEGWNTDRGRIVLKYGLPDDVERFFGGRENIQYEIWTFNALEGGAQFFFVDISKFGRYRLVHSTMLNEIKDFEWRDRYLK